ncbi:MAG: hypothetical protein FD150_602 [Rhodobacteraceae bacterium]|nr:MAG: hypothetical protein FD150_602 [Paracoccaceae bacterium]
MSNPTLSRRALIVSSAALFLLPALPSFALEPSINVAKDPTCPCCNDWVAILEQAGFAVTVEEMDPDALQQHKLAQGIPAEMQSCHTGIVEGYALEGHVPVADIRRLLAERPDAVGLAVPGMPFGSPGMGPEESREAYEVFLVRKNGTTEVFSAYAAA